MSKVRTVDLKTPFESYMDKIPFSEYPRPQLKRESYISLNGEWDFCIENENGISEKQKILVPFVPESRISGVFKGVEDDDTLIYERKFTLPEGFLKKRLILHFGAVDQCCEVFVNSVKVGENIGGYLPFSFDITEHLSEENTVTVRATDPLDIDLPYGKQTKRRGGMWYTKVSGIWGSVWLESVPENYIQKIKITPDLEGVDIEVTGGEDKKILIFGEKSYEFSGDKFRLNVENPVYWTPDTPQLYDFELISGSDIVSSYFGLRTVSVGEWGDKPCILLNGEPIFFSGLLDQGYFPDGIFLPANEDGFKFDIKAARDMGFNTLRKHIKLEPDLFYYYCDKFGMLVFQDMINSGKYSFLIDTALPTVFLKKGVTHKASEMRRKYFEETSKGIIENLYNHPCVVYYTIFNEGWGQFDADKYYTEFKKSDPTRIYDSTSGWFKERLSDVESEHIYFKKVKIKPSSRPVILSEFGGYSCKIEGHSFNLDKTYGYGSFKTPNEFEDALIELYEKQIIPAMDSGLCGCILTQISDIEDETNGLITYDRMRLKVNKERLRELHLKLYGEFLKKYKG